MIAEKLAAPAAARLTAPMDVDGGLPGGVGPADHDHPLRGHGQHLGDGCPIEHSGAKQCLKARDLQAAVADPGGNDHGPGDRLAAVGQGEDSVGAAGLQPGCGLGVHELGAEDNRLLGGPGGQLGAADAVRLVDETSGATANIPGTF